MRIVGKGPNGVRGEGRGAERERVRARWDRTKKARERV